MFLWMVTSFIGTHESSRRSGKVPYDYTIYGRTNEHAYMTSRNLTSQ